MTLPWLQLNSNTATERGITAIYERRLGLSRINRDGLSLPSIKVFTNRKVLVSRSLNHFMALDARDNRIQRSFFSKILCYLHRYLLRNLEIIFNQQNI